MKSKLFFTLFSILFIGTSVFAQVQEKINVNLYLTENHINTDLKEHFVKRIKKSNVVKDIDNHEFVHYFLDRYDTKYKKFIVSDLRKLNEISIQEAKGRIDSLLLVISKDFEKYKKENPTAPRSYNDNVNMRHFDIFDLGNKGPGDACNNADFETGNATGWDLTDGEVDATPYAYINVSPTTLAGSSQHTIVTGGNDPVIGAPIPRVNPDGGSSSLMLGDGTGSNYLAAGASQTFLVDSNSAAFTYSYALVMEDPSGHSQGEKPFFKVNMYDQSGSSIVCGDYSVISGPVNSGGDPDFIAYAAGFYLPWRTTFAPLQNYVGQNVTLELIIGDCGQGGHYGYGYIDASCQPLEIIPSQDVVCGGNPVTLTAPAGASSYLWAPGGQTTQTISTNVPGVYTVEVIPVTGVGCALTLTATIGGSPDYPVADFSATPLSACAGTPITFSNSSFVVGTSVIDSVQWDFNSDGIVNDTSFNTTYIYSSPGSYTVTLLVYNNGCIDDTTINITITPGTLANFSAPTVCEGQATIFSDASLPNGTVVNWNWDFDGDGTIDDTNQNPSFSFGTSGTYPVSLSVSGSGGSCPHDTIINIVVSPEPNVDFSAPSGCLGTITNFTDSSTISSGNITQWGWDFDNDGTVDNTTQNPSYTYPTAGTYNVNLTAGAGTCSSDTTISLTIDPIPLANFSASTVCDGQTTIFSDASLPTGTIAWNWDFDNDGTTDDTNQNPGYIFPSGGVFPVNLTVVIGNCEHDTTISVNVTVNNFSSSLSFTPPTPCGLDSFNVFMNFTGSNQDSLLWDMGNGIVIENVNPLSYTYPDAGTYIITMSAYNYACNIVETTINEVTFVDLEDGQGIIPNVFTPNGDGMNDRLVFLGVNGNSFFELKIYNRWGKLVFESTNPSDEWDGKINGGDMANDGTYFYHLTYTDVCVGDEKIVKGAVSLLK